MAVNKISVSLDDISLKIIDKIIAESPYVLSRSGVINTILKNLYGESEVKTIEKVRLSAN